MNNLIGTNCIQINASACFHHIDRQLENLVWLLLGTIDKWAQPKWILKVLKWNWAIGIDKQLTKRDMPFFLVAADANFSFAIKINKKVSYWIAKSENVHTKYQVPATNLLVHSFRIYDLFSITQKNNYRKKNKILGKVYKENCSLLYLLIIMNSLKNCEKNLEPEKNKEHLPAANIVFMTYCICRLSFI